jgi:predicted amidohydrolase YtcJ
MKTATARRFVLFLFAGTLAVGSSACADRFEEPKGDLILQNARVYTLDWDDPATDGTPAANAPFDDAGWHPDASALAIRGQTILYVGDDEGVEAHRDDHTRVVNLQGATVLPGLVDAHTHIVNLGTVLEQVNLVDVATEEEAVELVAQRAAEVPKGNWIVAYGWDDGAWADDYPDHRLLSARVPDHPVLMRGLHGFAVWGNRLALEEAGITAATEAPSGGRILKDERGNPTGLLLDRATGLLTGALPAPTTAQLESRILTAMQVMAEDGYTAVHEAGVGSAAMRAFENLAAERRMPLRVYVMLSARDSELSRQWLEWGPDTDGNDKLITRAVKAYYDAALGSRGARLLEDYTDMPGHRGVSGEEYGFNEELVSEMMAAGFQVAIHAIGDAGNRETLDFIDRVYSVHPNAKQYRHRIEHAQVVHPDDFRRFAEYDLIASVQPPHAMEDKAWALQRLGPERVLGAYAWRTFRQTGAKLAFSSDLPGSDHDIFYGLVAAMARQDKLGEPEGGWYPNERMTPEEAVRGYTSWAAYSAFLEDTVGTIAPGMWADITVMDVDPLTLGHTDPLRLLDGRILMTIVAGEIIYERN